MSLKLFLTIKRRNFQVPMRSILWGKTNRRRKQKLNLMTNNWTLNFRSQRGMAKVRKQREKCYIIVRKIQVILWDIIQRGERIVLYWDFLHTQRKKRFRETWCIESKKSIRYRLETKRERGKGVFERSVIKREKIVSCVI